MPDRRSFFLFRSRPWKSAWLYTAASQSGYRGFRPPWIIYPLKPGVRPVLPTLHTPSLIHPPTTLALSQYCGEQSSPPLWPAQIGRAVRPQQCACANRVANCTSCVHPSTTFFRLADQHSVSPTHYHYCGDSPQIPVYHVHTLILVSFCSLSRGLPDPKFSEKQNSWEKFYWNLRSVVMLHTPDYSSSKCLETIIFHEPLSRPTKFENKLRLLDRIFFKSPPDLAVFEPRVHSFPNSISTIAQKARCPKLTSGNIWARDGQINKPLTCMKMIFCFLKLVPEHLFVNLLNVYCNWLHPVWGLFVCQFLHAPRHLGQPFLPSVSCILVRGNRFCFVISL